MARLLYSLTVLAMLFVMINQTAAARNFKSLFHSDSTTRILQNIATGSPERAPSPAPITHIALAPRSSVSRLAPSPVSASPRDSRDSRRSRRRRRRAVAPAPGPVKSFGPRISPVPQAPAWAPEHVTFPGRSRISPAPAPQQHDVLSPAPVNGDQDKLSPAPSPDVNNESLSPKSEPGEGSSGKSREDENDVDKNDDESDNSPAPAPAPVTSPRSKKSSTLPPQAWAGLVCAGVLLAAVAIVAKFLHTTKKFHRGSEEHH